VNTLATVAVRLPIESAAVLATLMAARATAAVMDEMESATVRLPVKTRAAASVKVATVAVVVRVMDIAARATAAVMEEMLSATVRLKINTRTTASVKEPSESAAVRVPDQTRFATSVRVAIVSAIVRENVPARLALSEMGDTESPAVTG
jgi:hypothetical protein